MTRTYKLERLYHQFLKPKRISIDKLHILVAKLYDAEFIEVYRDPIIPDGERYSETSKLTDREHRDELFRIVQGLVDV